MKQVAIVGVEGSGKTVMLAGLGELYSHPDEKGYFLRPKNFQTTSYVMDKIARMRAGKWPTATADDAMLGLNWTLCQKRAAGTRPHDVCEISFLDFGGEVYRAAFGIQAGRDDSPLIGEIEKLKNYVSRADALVVLINLRDIIVKGTLDRRIQESIWITNGILSFALDRQPNGRPTRVSIALTQSDSYADTIRQCGGVKGVLAKYLPHVANSYDWLDVYAVAAVDKTVLDDEGNSIPAPDFKSTGLRILMDWIKGSEFRNPEESPLSVPQPLAEDFQQEAKKPSNHVPSSTLEQTDACRKTRRKKRKGGFFFSLGFFFSSLLRIYDSSGRSSRKEYWISSVKISCFLIAMILFVPYLGKTFPRLDPGILAVLAGIMFSAAIVLFLVLSVRRWHDVGLPGGMVLLYFIPGVGWLLPFVVGCLPGQSVPNKYGDPSEA